MRGHANHRVMFSVHVIVSFALTGCGSTHSPPKQQVQDTIAAALPPVLSLNSVELEPVSTGSESAKVNFKAIVTPKEDLHQVDREVEGTPRVTLLKVVQATGAKMSLYGSVEAHRMMDLWTLDSPQIQTGLEQLGKPRGAFPPQSYVTGSSEALAALKQQAANAEAQRQAKEAALRQQAAEEKAAAERREIEEKARAEREEKQRIAMEKQRAAIAEENRKAEEKRKAEEEAVRQKFLTATVAGTHYVGTLSHGSEVQSIRLVFTEQDNSLIRAEANNPDKPRWKQTFTGHLVLDPKSGRGEPDVSYIISLSPVGEQSINDSDDPFAGAWPFYTGNGSLKLRLTDTGLDGEAQMGGSEYTIHLQQGNGAVSKPASRLKPATTPRPAPRSSSRDPFR